MATSRSIIRRYIKKIVREALMEATDPIVKKAEIDAAAAELKAAEAKKKVAQDKLKTAQALKEDDILLTSLLEAEEDKQIEAIILRINSPGGAVGPTQEIYEEIQRIDKIKPIYASFGAIAASGGYYLGAGTRKIWASAGTLTGSIGVIMGFIDASKLIEFAKVNPQTVKAVEIS